MSYTENILEMLSDRAITGKDSQIYTPIPIAKEMVNILPEEVWNKDTTFLDPACKSGIFLHEIYLKLMETPLMIQDFPDKAERRKHILQNQLYGISPNDMCQLMSTRTVYGTIQGENNIISFESNYLAVMQNADKTFLYERLKKEFNTMKFDVVIGNPPYNKGMDLDFVDLAYKLSKQYVCMITPAKWKTADETQRIASAMSYGEFRQSYEPHMKYICFYPDCKDVFNIMQADGISWYLIDKLHTYDKCTIVNKLNANKVIDSVSERNLCDSNTLFNAGDEIIKYIGKYNNFTFPNCDYGRFRVFTNNHAPGGALYAFSPTASSIYIIGKSYLLDTHTKRLAFGETSLPDDAIAVYASDDLSECQSFLSWLKTKFIRFFVAVNISKLAPMMCNECFKLVPTPPTGKFDHIYTDEELYKAFNLPQKYIDIIEAVIKERK